MLHSRPLNAGALAGAHLQKISLDVVVPDGIQNFHAAGQAVQRNRLVIPPGLLGNGLQDAAGHRIEPCQRLMHLLGFGVFLAKGNSLFFHPVLELFKHENRLDAAGLRRLLLFGNAGAQEHHLDAAAIELAHHLGVGHRRRDHRRQAGNQLGIVFLHQHDDGRTAGGDDILHFVFFDQPGKLLGNPSRPNGRLFHMGEAQLFESGGELRKAGSRICGNIGRRHADEHLGSALQEFLDLGNVAVDLLGVLVTYHTGVLHDPGLLVMERNRLHGAVADALIAAFAVRFFKLYNTHAVSPIIIKAGSRSRRRNPHPWQSYCGSFCR